MNAAVPAALLASPVHAAPARGLAWLRLSLPAQPAAIAIVQKLLCEQARASGFAAADMSRMELACEESILTILRLTHGDDSATAGAANAGVFDIEVALLPPVLQLRITDHDLPYDLSLAPEFSPVDAQTAADDSAGLSAFLMQRMADVLRVRHPDRNGQSVELEWFLPTGAHPASQAVARIAEAGQPAAADGDLVIEALRESDAIQLARLMYRNYGYSYVNAALYAPEQILQRTRDGRLTSWVARLDGAKELVGHFALMKQHADDPVVEIGAGAVSPSVQGRGVFGQLLDAIETALPARSEAACCVHAVTCHPFTQKAVLRRGYEPCALLLAYTPATLQFRSVERQAGEQRGGVFYHVKLLKPQPPVDVHLPDEVRDLVLSTAQRIGLQLHEGGSAPVHVEQAATSFELDIEPALNSAFMQLRHWGRDEGQALWSQLRQLCRQRIDAIYLSLDLRRPDVLAAWPVLRGMGFIPAGLAPFAPGPAAFWLQYLNNQLVTPDAVHAAGAAAAAIKAQVLACHGRQESI